MKNWFLHDIILICFLLNIVPCHPPLFNWEELLVTRTLQTSKFESGSWYAENNFFKSVWSFRIEWERKAWFSVFPCRTCLWFTSCLFSILLTSAPCKIQWFLLMPVSSMIQIKFCYFPVVRTWRLTMLWLQPPEPEPRNLNLRSSETCGPELWNLKPVDLNSGTWNCL